MEEGRRIRESEVAGFHVTPAKHLSARGLQPSLAAAGRHPASPLSFIHILLHLVPSHPSTTRHLYYENRAQRLPVERARRESPELT